MTIRVIVRNQQTDLKISTPAIKKIVREFLAFEGQRCHEVSIHFITNGAICRLHQQYFNDPTPTDTISFPMDQDDDDLSYHILGDVFVCPRTAIEYAKKHNKDPYEETILYMIHGLLHLMGYDDLTPKDRRVMRQAERRAMERLWTWT